MPRLIYMSCAAAFEEQQMEMVQKLHDFLRTKDCVIQSSPYPFPGYPVIENMIEQCDVFIAIVGKGYSVSSWMNHELHYAWALHRFRFITKPRIFGLLIEGYSMPACSQHIEVEWINAENRNLLLTDLPRS